MKPTLVVLAAGMASRYGGKLKQMDGVGPHGEVILDYSVFDAIRGGFGKVVFVIRKKFAEEFQSIFNADRFNNQIEVAYVFQELDKLPAGFTPPADREKPWGTNHAVMMAAEAVDENFAVINADDFYGRDAIATMGSYLQTIKGEQNSYAMVGYNVAKTLSENGTVSRGVCQVDNGGYLQGMVERTKIERQNGQVVYIDDQGTHPLADNAPVSMNLFGFTPDYFRHSQTTFAEFLGNEENMKNLKSEFYIPFMVNRLIESGTAKMRVLTTTSDWFGVTYQEDRPGTVAKLLELAQRQEYPAPLWGPK